ncbi:hypothetical protein STA3757_35180 [Stanieria sp. NIES-3757]|nr:hypothetical protein STA3757_35180 [Stanieria sp. NIES-3757]
MSYQCERYQGENDKEYWIAAREIKSVAGKNYEVKYRQFEKGDMQQKIFWDDPSWRIFLWCKADSSIDAILQGKEKLQKEGVLR